MNKSLKIFVSASMTMATVLSCQKEANAPSEPETFHITVKTSVDNLSGEDQTRTYIDETNTILWGTGEYMKIAVKTGETTTFGTSKADCADLWNGDDQAYFEFDLNLSGAGESYTYMGLYPASAAVSSSDNNKPDKYKVALPDIQNATTASYDPAAYIMVAKPEEKNAFENEWIASYRRATALNKVTLKNIKDDIISVEFTAADGIYMAGRRYIDLETGKSGEIYSGGGRTETITVKYNNEPLSGDDKVIWFTSWDTEIPAGKTFKIVAKSASKTYTRTLEVANNPICFKEGYLNILNVNMENAEVESVSGIAEGDYLILAKNNNTYYALKAEVSGTRIASKDYDGNLESYYGDASLIWTITPSGTSYTIKNGDNYLGYTDNNNGNTASLVKQEEYSDKACKMSIDDNKDGTYKISVTADPNRSLARNQSNSYFAFYTGTQYLNLVLVPAVVDNRAEAQISWSATAANVVLNGDYTAIPKFNNPNELSVNFESSNTTVATVSTEGEISIIGPGETKITATFDGDDSFKESTVTTEIRVTEEGQELIQYEKVATTYDDWTGTYLIVAEGANGAANVAKGEINSKWLLSETVQMIVDNTLDATTTNDGFSVNIEKAPNSTNYYIKFNSGYLGTTDSNDGIKVESTPTNDSYWTFSYDKETNLVKITSTIKEGRHLRYNSSGFRTYAGTTGTQATLFKRSVSLVNGGNTGNGGEGTTDPEPSVDTEHEGTAEDPFSVADAILMARQAGTAGTDAEYYITGKISQIDEISATYGNATFYIKDENGETFQIFRVLSFDGKNFTGTEPLKIDDEVVALGKLKLYNDTPEMTDGKLISVNGKTSFDDSTGEGGNGGDTTDPENPGGDGGEGEGDTEPEEIELTFDLTKNPNNWPDNKSSAPTNASCDYELNGKSYTFNLTNCRCYSGYLMLTATAYLGLPAVEGYKLTKVVGTGNKGASNATSVSIVTATSNGNIIGAAQTWIDNTTPGSYIYSLSGTSEGTMYYMKAETKNCQCTKLVLTYHK